MGAILSAIVSGILKGLFGLFRTSPEEKLGQLEVKNEDAQKETAELTTALAAGDSIDRTADPDVLRGKLNARP